MPHQKNIVTEERIRDIFNAQVEHRILSGQYTLNVITAKNPDKKSIIPQGTLPAGTKSTIFEVLNQSGAKIGTVHAMIGPNGEVLGSGRYDPKELLIGNTRYLVQKK